MSGVHWGAIGGPLYPRTVHDEVRDAVTGAMETGRRGTAAELLKLYASEHPEQAEALRLSLVRKYSTGL